MYIGGINLEHLDVAYFYLFDGVNFLHLLLLLMALDIVTRLTKAVKKAIFGAGSHYLVPLVNYLY